MNKKIFLIVIVASCFFLTACQKNIDIFVPDNGQLNSADTTWANAITAAMPVSILQNDLIAPSSKDSFEINNNTNTVNTSTGLQLVFPPLCGINNNGQLVTGKVIVETYLITKKGDMVMMNKPTSANNKIIVNGSEIYLSIKKDNQELQLAPNIKIQIKYNDVITSSIMKLFFGDESNPLQFNWIKNTDTTSNYLGVSTQQPYFQILTNHLHWINCGYFLDTTNISLSTISTKLPSNYTNANTSVFLVFKDIKSVLKLNSAIPEKLFVTEKIPSAKLATIVVLSKQVNDYYLGKLNITTGTNLTAGSINQANTITPIKTSLNDIKVFLASL